MDVRVMIKSDGEMPKEFAKYVMIASGVAPELVPPGRSLVDGTPDPVVVEVYVRSRFGRLTRTRIKLALDGRSARRLRRDSVRVRLQRLLMAIFIASVVGSALLSQVETRQFGHPGAHYHLGLQTGLLVTNFLTGISMIALTLLRFVQYPIFSWNDKIVIAKVHRNALVQWQSANPGLIQEMD